MHSGPFIVTKNNAPTCDVSRLKCAACLCAKATIKTPTSTNLRESIKQGLLKTDDLSPGACILADHYFSSVQGRLPQRMVIKNMATLAEVSLLIMPVAKYSTSLNSRLILQKRLQV